MEEENQKAIDNAMFKKLLDSLKAFRPDSVAWFRVAEGSFDSFMHRMSAANRI